jgi:hypothetical protein
MVVTKRVAQTLNIELQRTCFDSSSKVQSVKRQAQPPFGVEASKSLERLYDGVYDRSNLSDSAECLDLFRAAEFTQTRVESGGFPQHGLQVGAVICDHRKAPRLCIADKRIEVSIYERDDRPEPAIQEFRGRADDSLAGTDRKDRWR